MTYEVLHRPSRFGWEHRCPLLGIEGGATTYGASCTAAEHAVRLELASQMDVAPSMEVVRAHVHHHRETGDDTLYTGALDLR